MNVPVTFNRSLQILPAGYCLKTCLIHLDDVTVFSKGFETHFQNFNGVLRTLRTADVSTRSKNFDRLTTQVNYPGLLVRPGQLVVDKTRMKRFDYIQHPRTRNKLRSIRAI